MMHQQVRKDVGERDKMLREQTLDALPRLWKHQILISNQLIEFLSSY